MGISSLQSLAQGQVYNIFSEHGQDNRWASVPFRALHRDRFIISFQNMGRITGMGISSHQSFAQGQVYNIFSEHGQDNRWASVPIRVLHRDRLTASLRTGAG